jgi:hypothetical protein
MYAFPSETLTGTDHVGDLCEHERINIKMETGCGSDSSGSHLGPVPGSFGHINEDLGFIKGGEFLDQLGKKCLSVSLWTSD